MNIPEGSDLLQSSIFMLEQTSAAIHAETFLCEGFAKLGFILLILRLFGRNFYNSMGKLAFWSIAALAILNPVLAHLSLVLSFVHFTVWSSLRVRKSSSRSALGFSLVRVCFWLWKELGGNLNYTRLCLLIHHGDTAILSHRDLLS